MLFILLALLLSLVKAFPDDWLKAENRESLIQSMDAASLEYSHSVSSRFESVGVICYKGARLETLIVFFGKVVVLSGTKNVLQEDGGSLCPTLYHGIQTK